ncbi:MAG: hypothetical protein OXQ92_01770, partial [Boseongicola sp.]|nr:hypothetical protein [Boseongicola sp.]
MTIRGTSQVAKRRVFYIPGYDPFPPRRYRELYRKESRKQALLSGYQIEQKPGSSDTGWLVRSRIEGGKTLSRIDVLVWSDLVRSSMSTGIIGTYFSLAKTSWTYFSTGTFRRLTWLRKGPVIAALYPVVMLLAQLMAALLVAGIATGTLEWGASLIAGFVGASVSGVAATMLSVVSWGLFLGFAYLILKWFKSLDGKTFAYYLMNDFAYTASKNGAYPDEIEARLHEFRHRIEAALRDEDVDEVLIVGHSSGAHMAV